MKVQILSLIFILSLLCKLEAKAFQTDAETGNNDHMYANLYFKNTAAGLHSSPGIYSDGHQNYELRYVPHVDGNPIFIPPINVNELEAFPTTPTFRNRPKQWQYRYQFKKPQEEKIAEKHNFHSEETPKVEIKSKTNDYYIQSKPDVEPLTKAKEILDKIKIKQTQNVYGNLMTSENSDEVKYDEYDNPQTIRTDNKKIEAHKKEHAHIVTKSKDTVNDYDHSKVKNTISKEKQMNNKKVYSMGTNPNKPLVKEIDYDDYDSPEVIDSLSNDYLNDGDSSEQPDSLTNDYSIEDYDSPIVKNPLTKTEEKVEIKQMYNSKEGSYKVTTKIPYHDKVKKRTSHTKPQGYKKKVDIHSSIADSADFLSNMPDEERFEQMEELTKKKPTKNDYSDMKSEEYETPKVTSNEKNGLPKEYQNSKQEISKKDKVKKTPIKQEEEDWNDYDSPVVVEALVKKRSPHDAKYKNPKQTLSNENSDEDYSDYDSPMVVEALTKKKPAKKTDKTDSVKIKKETVKPDSSTKASVYQSYKYPIYFDSDSSKGHKDVAKPKIALSLKTPSPVFNVDDPNIIPVTESFHDADLEMLNDSDQLDGSGLVDARSGNNEESRSLFLKSNVWSLMSNFHSQERGKFKKCLTPNKEPGNCMPIQMCPVPDLQLTLNDLLKKVCTIDDVFIGICCPEFPAETLKVAWDNINGNISADEENNTDTKAEECGLFEESGENVQSWPWMAPLISVSTRRIFCGGVLIKEQYVLTAAHCTRKIPHNQILVVLGALNSEQDPTNQEFAVVEIKRHAQYNPRTMQNDIALLKLSRKVPLGDKRRFVCLPDEEEMNVGNEAFMLGWQGSFSASKNEESLRVISPEECRKGVKIVVGPNVMCTEPRTEDVMCNLDSGAPLTVKRDGRFHVVGIMTWNRNDCDSSFPTIFTRVSHFKKWIDNHSS